MSDIPPRKRVKLEVKLENEVDREGERGREYERRSEQDSRSTAMAQRGHDHLQNPHNLQNPLRFSSSEIGTENSIPPNPNPNSTLHFIERLRVKQETYEQDRIRLASNQTHGNTNRSSYRQGKISSDRPTSTIQETVKAEDNLESSANQAFSHSDGSSCNASANATSNQVNQLQETNDARNMRIKTEHQSGKLDNYRQQYNGQTSLADSTLSQNNTSVSRMESSSNTSRLRHKESTNTISTGMRVKNEPSENNQLNENPANNPELTSNYESTITKEGVNERDNEGEQEDQYHNHTHPITHQDSSSNFNSIENSNQAAQPTQNCEQNNDDLVRKINERSKSDNSSNKRKSATHKSTDDSLSNGVKTEVNSKEETSHVSSSSGNGKETNDKTATTTFTLDNHKIIITGIIEKIVIVGNSNQSQISAHCENGLVPLDIISKQDNIMDSQTSSKLDTNSVRSNVDKGNFSTDYARKKTNKDSFEVDGDKRDPHFPSEFNHTDNQSFDMNEKDSEDDSHSKKSNEMTNKSPQTNRKNRRKEPSSKNVKQNSRKEKVHTISSLSKGNVDHKDKSSEKGPAEMALCCASCLCSKKAKDKSGGVIMNCGNSGNSKLFHNFCCHNIPKREQSEDWKSPLQQAAEAEVEEKSPPKIVTLTELKKKMKRANEKEKKFQQKVFDADDFNNEYPCDLYNAIQKSKEKLDPLTVLDVFSGIGGSISGLKRLGIAIKTVISVENDPVARYVAKFNNLSTYNKNLDEDDIEYVEKFHTFEELAKNLDSLLGDYGPIDLIIGKPPISTTGKHVLDFAKFVGQIEEHPLQKQSALFFLSENMIVKRSSFGSVSKAYNNIPPILFDSKSFSPCSKSRTYWSNLPINKTKIVSIGEESRPMLDDDFEMPEIFCNEEDNDFIKAKSFQTFDSIDDDRMIKVKEVEKEGQTQFEIHKFSVADRERMLGLKDGYVENALTDLFKHLKQDAFMAEFMEGSKWSNMLDEKYFDMTQCKYSFQSSEDFYDILIAPPNESKSTPHEIFLNKQMYAKQLLGNTTSIAMMERLLKPLAKICKRRTYDDFDYDFSWSRSLFL